jgi:hypothetical protein
MSTDKIVTASDLDERMMEMFEACQDGFLSLPMGSMSFLDEYFCSEQSSVGCCGPLFEIGMKQKERIERRVGGGAVRGEGPADATPGTESSLPPITNRGATKHRRANSSEFQLGGYDGGVEVGFEGVWESSALPDLVARLEAAKQAASEASHSVSVDLCGLPVLVEPTGATDGLHYRYVFVLGGVKFFIHHKPPKDRQGVRVRYSAAALIGRNLFSLHRGVLDFLSGLGFSVREEKLSRVDLQVLVETEVSELVLPIIHGHDVCRAQKDGIRRSGGKIETYTRGSKGRIEVSIYDKKREMEKSFVSEPVKFKLMIDHCIGEEWYFSDRPITRVEFRLWRDTLRALEIDSVQDLQDCERALVDWLTNRWFRLLENPAVHGHEHTAKLHPLWEKVRSSFRAWFRGVDDGKSVTWQRPVPISCDSTPLTKQGVGCIAKAIAIEAGARKTAFEVYQLACEKLRLFEKTLFDKVSACVERLGLSSGVLLGESSYDYSARNACSTVIDAKSWFGVRSLEVPG